MKAYTIDGAWICWALRQKKEEPRVPLEIRLPFNGAWLQPVRDAAERLRRAALKKARKSNPQPKKEGK